jgi:phosphoribosylglycinamide formyltransferase 1
MNKKKFKIGVLGSTNGTDLQAIIDEMKAKKMPGIELSIVISNKSDSYILERAHYQGYETLFLGAKGRDRKEYDMEIAEVLESYEVDLVILIGYMRVLCSEFIKKFEGRIINVHPSLIPKFCGKNFFGNNVHEAVIEAGETETGMTIHFVDESVDGGPIIVQKKCKVTPDDTPETLKGKVQKLEKKWYPEIIRKLAAESR